MSDQQQPSGLPEDGQPLQNYGAAELSPAEEERCRELRDAAVGYARLGYRVIPVQWITGDGNCHCKRGAACASPGKHPVPDDWPDHATAAEDRITMVWWRSWLQEPADGSDRNDWCPLANVGIVTGRASGIFVVDIDPVNGGDDTLRRLEQHHGELPLTRIHSTGSGGTHYFFRYPAEITVRNSKSLLGRGIDIRGDRGFVVAPPSISGVGSYEINPAHDRVVAEAPFWLLERLREADQDQRGEMVTDTAPVRPSGNWRAYVTAAVRAEAGTLARTAEGRNNQLNSSAFSLGTLGAHGLLDEETAWRALLEACGACGVLQEDGQYQCRATFRSGWRSGMQQPRDLPADRDLDEMQWHRRPRTEYGLAHRLVEHFGDELRWNLSTGKWMHFSGGCWSQVTAVTAFQLVQTMIEKLMVTEGRFYSREPEENANGDPGKVTPYQDFEAWVKKQQTTTKTNNVVSAARGLPIMQVRQDEFDSDEMLLNCMNGVLDLRTGTLTEHKPDQMLAMQAAARHVPGAQCPRWLDHLEQVLPDPAVRSYFHRIAGYSVTGKTGEQAFFLHHGNGANGKSVTMDVISGVLGTYAQIVPVETLMERRGSGDRIPNDVARMQGKRFLIASETKSGKKLDEQFMKSFTGDSKMVARFMRGEFFEFDVTGKLHLSTNHLPDLSQSNSIWRRNHLLPWEVTIPDEEQEKDLAERIIADEAAGVLGWLVEGCLLWQAEGLAPPERALIAKAEYRKGQDIFGGFIQDRLEVTPGDEKHFAPGTAVYAAYQGWCAANGHKQPMNKKHFVDALGRRGLRYIKNNHGEWRNVWGFFGVILKVDWPSDS